MLYNPLLPHTTSDREKVNITIKPPHATLVKSMGAASAAANAGVAMAIIDAEAAANMARRWMATSLSDLRWATHLTGPIWTVETEAVRWAGRRSPAKEAQAPTTGAETARAAMTAAIES